MGTLATRENTACKCTVISLCGVRVMTAGREMSSRAAGEVGVE
jgi:hypothetical protein